MDDEIDVGFVCGGAPRFVSTRVVVTRTTFLRRTTTGFGNGKQAFALARRDMDEEIDVGFVSCGACLTLIV